MTCAGALNVSTMNHKYTYSRTQNKLNTWGFTWTSNRKALVPHCSPYRHSVESWSWYKATYHTVVTIGFLLRGGTYWSGYKATYHTVVNIGFLLRGGTYWSGYKAMYHTADTFCQRQGHSYNVLATRLQSLSFPLKHKSLLTQHVHSILKTVHKKQSCFITHVVHISRWYLLHKTALSPSKRGNYWCIGVNILGLLSNLRQGYL